MSIKIVTVVGARPQFIKAATVSRVLGGMGASEVIIHTGQHYDPSMSDIFFQELNIPKPDYHLGVGSGPHGQMTGRQLEKIELVLKKEAPDWVLVYGDTNSTLAGGLAAVKMHIPVAHVEAGLRSFNRRMPEEINRILTDHMSDLLFPPTRVAQGNLIAEGIPSSKIELVGDVMFDAAIFYAARSRPPSWWSSLGLVENEFVLATVHRAENTDFQDRLASIVQALGSCGLPVVLPLHPRTRSKITEFGMKIPGNVILVDPVGYLEMVWLEKKARLVATDSGGVQKEAYFHGVRCVTMRDETEWVELVDSGWNVLVGCDAERMREAMTRPVPRERAPLYGDGTASQLIAAKLLS